MGKRIIINLKGANKMTSKYTSIDEAVELVKEHIGLNFSGSDPLNTNILKTKLYPRRILGAEKTGMSFDEAYALGVYITGLGRKLFEVKNIDAYKARCLSIATALQASGMTANEIAGISSAVFDYDIPNFVNPISSDVADNCGMGGDNVLTPNVSTVSLLSVANYKGIKACKHGSPGNTDSAGSSDFFGYLLRTTEPSLIDKVFDKMFGLPINISPEKVAELIDDTGFFYTEAVDEKYKTIHFQTHVLGMIAHINDILGPITNPVSTDKLTKRIVGVNHLVSTGTVAEAYNIMNKRGITNVKDAFIVRGLGKFEVDEFSTLGDNEVTEIRNGKVKGTVKISPEEFGLDLYKPKNVSLIRGRLLIPGISPRVDLHKNLSGAEVKANMSKQLLYNKVNGPARELILANMSALLVLYNEAKDFRSGTELADQLLTRKNGVSVLEDIVERLCEI